MWIKHNIIWKNVSSQDIIEIISHDTWKYTKVIIVYALILAVLFVSYDTITHYFVFWIIDVLFAGIWIVVYFFFMVSFFDVYLDSLILTSTWIIIYRWHGLFRQHTENIPRESAQAIYDQQSGILDALLNKWNIEIKRHEETYLFEDVPSPAENAKKIVAQRDAALNQANNVEEEEEQDKFDVLVETLWEVILDYVKNNKKWFNS